MAEFDFYGTWEDVWSLVQKLTDLGQFTFVVDKPYTEPMAFEFTNFSADLEAMLCARPRVYLLSEEYSRFPLQFHEARGHWMIDELSSGPTLDLCLPICFERDGKLCLYQGYLGHLACYQDPETGQWYKAPQALKRAYEKTRALLRKGMAKRYLGCRSWTPLGDYKPRADLFWIAQSAMAMMDSGLAGILLGQANFVLGESWVTGADLAKTRGEVRLPDEYGNY